MKNTGLFNINSKFRKQVAGLVIILLLTGLFATDLPLRAEITLIKFYKGCISPFSSTFITCRFNPT